MNMRDVARKAGVSVMTVSRALRHDPKVSPARQRQIREIARRLGYRPNPLVAALMSNRGAGRPHHQNLKLAFISNYPTRDGWKQIRLYREFFEGACRGANQHGYGLEEFWLREPGMTPHRLSQVLRTRNIRGVLLAPLPEAEGRVELEWSSFSAVAFGYSIIEPELHRVSNYQFRSMRLLLTRLRQLGYQRPGLALSKRLDDRVLHQWLGAFLAEQGSHWLDQGTKSESVGTLSAQRPAGPGAEPATAQDAFARVLLVADQQWTAEQFEGWLRRACPDVVIGQQRELLEWLRQSGRRMPRDIGFAHLDCPSPTGPVSGIYQNGPEIGMAAANALVAMLQRNEHGIPTLPNTLLIEASWVRGTTLSRHRKIN